MFPVSISCLLSGLYPMSQLLQEICLWGQDYNIFGKLGKIWGPVRKFQETRLYPPLLALAQLDKVTECHKLLCQSPQEPLPAGGIASAYAQKCSRADPKSKISVIFQPTFLGPKTQQQVEPYSRPEQSESIPQGQKIQNGDIRNLQDIPPTRRVDYLNRFQGHL